MASKTRFIILSRYPNIISLLLNQNGVKIVHYCSLIIATYWNLIKFTLNNFQIFFFINPSAFKSYLYTSTESLKWISQCLFQIIACFDYHILNWIDLNICDSHSKTIHSTSEKIFNSHSADIRINPLPRIRRCTLDPPTHSFARKKSYHSNKVKKILPPQTPFSAKVTLSRATTYIHSSS